MTTDAGAASSRPTLQTFTLDDLAVYTAEQAFGPTASPDFRVFYVGRDDVHGVTAAAAAAPTATGTGTAAGTATET
ncbi:MAG TPA: hypothetical protein VJ371_21025 [Streptosporangiaceae bacterium]|jgi:hypothetical protein|nr:hypothetical protein [Streptosporangiaceae bacterium]